MTWHRYTEIYHTPDINTFPRRLARMIGVPWVSYGIFMPESR